MSEEQKTAETTATESPREIEEKHFSEVFARTLGEEGGAEEKEEVAAKEPEETKEDAPASATGEEDSTKEDPKKKLAEDQFEGSKKLSYLARKEAAARQRIKDEETKLAQQRKESEELIGKASRIVDVVQVAHSDPARFYKEAFGLEGPALEPIAKRLYFSAIGKDAPVDVQHANALSAFEQRIRQIEAENRELRNQVTQQQYQSAASAEGEKYKARLHEFVRNIPEDFEHLSVHAMDDANEVVDAMVQQAVAILEREGEDGDYPDPRRVAEELEEQVAARWDRRYGKSDKFGRTRPKKQAGQKKRSSPALSASQIGTQSERQDAPPTDPDERVAWALRRADERARSGGEM